DQRRVADANLRDISDREVDLARKEILSNARKAEAERVAAEEDKLRQSLRNVANLRGEGKWDEAGRITDDLARRYPVHPSVIAANRTPSTPTAGADNRALRDERDRRMLGVYLDIERSALPPIGDIEFPPDWKEKTERRAKYNGPPMTPKEKALLKSL